MMNMKMRAPLGVLAALLLAGSAMAQPLQIEGSALNRSTINGSITITTGGTFQQILPSIAGTSTQRQALTIQNNNTNGDNCLVIFGTIAGVAITVANANATSGKAILLAQGGSFQRYFPYVPGDAILATCATTSDTLYVDTQ